MKHYITLFTLLLAAFSFAQNEDPITIIKSVKALQDETIAKMKANTDKAKNDLLYEQYLEKAQEKLSVIQAEETYEYPSSLKLYIKEGVGFVPKFQKVLNETSLEDAWNEGFAGFYFKKGYTNKIWLY